MCWPTESRECLDGLVIDFQILEQVPSNYENFAEACVTSFLASSTDKYRTKDLGMLLRGLFVLNFDVRPHEKRLLQAEIHSEDQACSTLI